MLARIALALIGIVHAASILSTGSSLTLNGIPHYIPADPVATLDVSPGLLKSLPSAAGLIPMTVISTARLNFAQADLDATVANFSAIDDVFQSGFAEGLFLQYSGNLPAGPKSPFSPQLKGSNSTVLGTSLSARVNGTSTLPNGPYFISTTGAVFQPWRLYSDFAAAFTQPLVPDGKFYAPIPVAIAGIQSPAVAVPSRLYFTPTREKPLAGVRLGIKDIFDVAGVKTSDGNRAFYGLYPEKMANAVAVQKLIDAGAVVVGKMKTSQFANGEVATEDWIDYHSPFNPRGDGYNDPSSSSSGPGAGAASYPWLDLTLGSDTGGSIRGPSQVNGLFGNRPSHGLVDLTGVMPLAPQLDTAGFLCRDPTIWETAARVLYDGLEFYTEFPSKISLFTNFPTSGDSPSDAIILGFLGKLENFLSATSTTLDLNALWTQTKPSTAPNTLIDLLNITYPIIISQEQTKLVRDPFYAAYAAVHDGRLPAVDTVPLVRWAFGDSYPASALTDAVNNKTIFMDWFNTHVLVNDSTTCSDSLLLYVGSTADSSNPRNFYGHSPGVPVGFGPSRIGPFAEVPDFVVPIGQASYNSTITLHEEQLPITIDFLAAKGCDGMIFQLVEALRTAGIVSPVQAGQTILGGEILL